MHVGIISPVIINSSYMPCYLVIQEITELLNVIKLTGDSKQSFYNNIEYIKRYITVYNTI